MKLQHLILTLRTTVLRAALKAIPDGGGQPDRLSLAQAYRLYGRSNIDRWHNEGLLKFTGVKGKSTKKFIDRLKLEALAASSNRITYLPVAER